jgi:hypothetical protein
LKFEINDDDGSGSKDEIGSVETTLGSIAGSQNQTFKADIKKSGKLRG